MSPSQPNRYQQRINQVLAYLNEHLTETLNIKKLAEVSCFSMFHFQRIYQALQGESPYETLLRLRLEKSVFLLKFRPKMKIVEVALASGFQSHENFSRQFKSRYQCTPSEFRQVKSKQNSRIYQATQKEGFYTAIEASRTEPMQAFSVVVDELPAIRIAFIRAVFGADGSGLIERYHDLMQWCDAHGIQVQGALKRFGMSIDNPDVTPEDKYRYDFAVHCEPCHQPSGLIELGTIPAGGYATIHCQGKLHDVAQAWDYLYRVWLPESDYMPLHYPAIEEFVQGPEEIGWDNFNIKCRIPVVKGE